MNQGIEPMSPIAKLATRPDPLEVFTARTEARAYLWREGDLDLHEAVDVLQAAAVQTGLAGALGQDAVQAIMAKAFAAVRKPQIVGPVADVVLDPPPEPEPAGTSRRGEHRRSRCLCAAPARRSGTGGTSLSKPPGRAVHRADLQRH